MTNQHIGFLFCYSQRKVLFELMNLVSILNLNISKLHVYFQFVSSNINADSPVDEYV